MIIEPKVRGFICTTAHPLGCEARVIEQINYALQQPKLPKKYKNVLIIGASTGYGLASRIVASIAGANTLGVFFEREAMDKRTASAGWYNTAAFEKYAHQAGLYARSINGDAFSAALKQQVIDCIRQDLNGKVDLIIYSLAAPRRQDANGVVYSSTLKAIDRTFKEKTVDIVTGIVSEVEIAPATEAEIQGTIKVMGGEDWALWIEALIEADVLAPQATSLAYSYIGPEMTYPIYWHGTIGKAKEDLQNTSRDLNDLLAKHCQGRAFISVNKGLVTQASAAIPVVPLYISLLYKIMKEKNTHEGCIEQMWRLFRDHLYSDAPVLDSDNRIRLDDLELCDDVQQRILELWPQIQTDNLEEVTDIVSFRREFYQLFGFAVDSIDYTLDVDINVPIPSIHLETV